MKNKVRVAVMIDLQWPVRHHSDVYQGILRFLNERDWASHLDPFADRLLLDRRPSSKPFDGIIARATPELMRRALRADIPVVNVWRNTPVEKVASVFPDFAAGGRAAAEHLLRRGFRRFAYIGFRRDQADADIREAFASAVRDRGHPCAVSLVSHNHSASEDSWAAFTEALGRAISNWETPVGVMTGNDMIARVLIDSCSSLGLKVPRDVSVVCCESWQPLCLGSSPSLTGIDLGYTTVGYEAAKALRRMIGGRVEGTPTWFTPPAGLTPRQSSDSFAVDDRITAAALRFISENCDRGIGAGAVASAVATTARTLQRRFKTHVGHSVIYEINRSRCERAKRMLRDSEALLEEIAQDCGFAGARQMREVFLRLEGTPPSAYRESFDASG